MFYIVVILTVIICFHFVFKSIKYVINNRIITKTKTQRIYLSDIDNDICTGNAKYKNIKPEQLLELLTEPFIEYVPRKRTFPKYKYKTTRRNKNRS